MQRRFVVVSGLPGSGKSRLARELTPLLGLPVVDKDDILEGLFNSRGVRNSAARRAALSREGDRIFQREAEASQGALLVSFWRLPGMTGDSGTPTDWLLRLSAPLVNLHCECPPEIAAARFQERKRHPGHLDNAISPAQILQSIRDVERCKPLEIGLRVTVDTSALLSPEAVAGEIAAAFASIT